MSYNYSVNILITVITAMVVSGAMFYIMYMNASKAGFSELTNNNPDQAMEADFQMEEPVIEVGDIAAGRESEAVAIQEELQRVTSVISSMSEFMQSDSYEQATEEQQAEFLADFEAYKQTQIRLEAEYESMRNNSV